MATRALTAETTGIKRFEGRSGGNTISFRRWRLQICRYIDGFDDPELMYDYRKYGKDNYLDQFTTTDAKKNARQLNSQCLTLLNGHLSEDLAEELGQFRSAAGAWHHLNENYDRKDFTQISQLLRTFFRLRATTIDDVEEFINKINSTSNELTSSGETIPDHFKSAIFLGGLPESLVSFVDVIDLESIKMMNTEGEKQLNTRLDFAAHVRAFRSKHMRTEETRDMANRLNEVIISRSDQTMKNKNKNEHLLLNQPQAPCSTCITAGRSMRIAKSHIANKCFGVCSRCDRFHNPMKGCAIDRGMAVFEKRVGENRKVQNSEVVNFAREENEKYKINIFYSNVHSFDKYTMSKEQDNKVPNQWQNMVDSGCTQHIVNSLEILVNVYKKNTRFMLADGKFLVASHIGDLPIICSSHNKQEEKLIVLTKVYFSVNLKSNLLSVSRLCKENLEVRMSNEEINIFRHEDKFPTMTGNRIDNYWQVKCRLPTDTEKSKIIQLLLENNEKSLALRKISPSNSWQLWHERLGHPGNQIMRRLSTKLKLPVQNERKCEPCIQGKAHITKLPAMGTRATEVLEIVASDIFVSPIPTFNGNKYMLIFTDDFSNFVAGTLLKSKTADHVKRYFMEYKLAYENLSGQRIKTFRADRGGEFKNDIVESYLKSQGISIQFACAGASSHGQNGSAERINRTLIERALSMIWKAKVDSSYWGEAMSTAIFLHNRLPNKDGVTPMELMTNVSPGLLSLKVWGCIAFIVHPRADRPNKLASKSTKGRFIGYDNQSKGYRIRVGNKIMIAIDVHFWEDTFDMDNEKVVAYDVLTLEEQSNFWGTISPSRNVLSTEVVPSSTNDIHFPSDNRTIRFGSLPPTFIGNNPVEQIVIPTPTNVDTSSDDENTSDSEQDIFLTPTRHSSTPQETPVPIPTTPTLRRSDRIRGPPKEYWKLPNTSEAADLSSDESSVNYVQPIDQLSQVDADLENEACKYLSIQNDENITLQNHCMRIEAAKDCPIDIPTARMSAEAEQWEEAIRSEHESLIVNNVYTWVPKPDKSENILVVPSRVVLSKKPDENLNMTRHKCRIVAKGYTQIEGVHFEETYAPTAKLTTIRTLFAKAVKEDLIVHQMDVKTAFLYAPIDKPILMQPPKGIHHPEGKIWKLNKALYGLKQSPHLWNIVLHEFLTSKEFVRAKADPCLYSRRMPNNRVVEIAVYVDDLIIAATHQDILMLVKKQLSEKFQMKDMGECKYCLGIQVTKTSTGLKLHSTKLIKDVLDRFNMSMCNSSKIPMEATPLGRPLTPEETVYPYRELVGSLQYISIVGCTLMLTLLGRGFTSGKLNP